MKWTWLKRLIGREERVEATAELRHHLLDHRPEAARIVEQAKSRTAERLERNAKNRERARRAQASIVAREMDKMQRMQRRRAECEAARGAR